MSRRATPAASGRPRAARLLWIAPLVGGAIHALSFAPGPLPAALLPVIQLLSLAILAFCTFRSASIKQACLAGFSFGLSWFCVGLYWLYISMHVYGNMVAPLAAGGVFALSAYLSIYPALACGLVRWLAPMPAAPQPTTAESSFDFFPASASAAVNGPQPRLSALPRAAILFSVLTWAAAWSLSEWLRGVVFTGFPWLNVGYAHVDSPFAGWAPVLGIYGVAFWVAFVAAALALLAYTCRSPSTPTENRAFTAQKKIVLGVAVASALVGWGLSIIPWASSSGEPLNVQLLQGNIPQSQKFDPALMESGIVAQLALAGQELPNTPRPDLVLLPETVLPVFQNPVSPNVWRAWRDIADRRDTTLIMGAPLNTVENGQQRYTNSVIAIDSDTSIQDLQAGNLDWQYDKRHLVPFGEFVPTGFRWFVNAMQIPLGDFDRGPIRQTPYDIGDQRIALNICYEDLFGEELLPALHADSNGPGATILANVSNLGWFGDSWALRQHLQIARMRTIETARPMLASTNTGITAAIDHTGHVVSSIASHQPGVLAVTVQGMSGFTPYARFGNAVALALAIVVLVVAFVRRKRGLPRA